LKDPAFHPYLEYYDYLRELARKADKDSTPLAGFLDMIRPHLGKYERIGELEVLKEDERAAGGVQILTVHRAKGLEFPVVIFSDTGSRVRSSGTGAPFYFSDYLGLTFNIVHGTGKQRRKTNFFYTRGKDEQEQKEIAETKRILYVALTRAKNHLVISGRHNPYNRKNDGVPLNMVLTALGWEPGTDVLKCEALHPYLSVIDDVPADLLRTYRPEVSYGKAPSAQEALSLYRRAGILENPSSPPQWSASVLESMVCREWTGVSELPAIESDVILSSKDLEADFGTLCHALVEDAMGGRKGGGVVPPKMRMHLEADELESVLRDANGLVSGFFASPLGKSIDGALNAETEVSFLLRYQMNDSEAFISGAIDMLVERDGEMYVIDFKTDKLLRGGEYHVQIEIYREAVMQWTDKPVRCFIVYLRNNSVVEVERGPLPDFFTSG